LAVIRNRPNYKEPIILVVKKNYRTLDNIINWLRGTTDKEKLSSYPLLITRWWSR